MIDTFEQETEVVVLSELFMGSVSRQKAGTYARPAKIRHGRQLC